MFITKARPLIHCLKNISIRDCSGSSVGGFEGRPHLFSPSESMQEDERPFELEMEQMLDVNLRDWELGNASGSLFEE